MPVVASAQIKRDAFPLDLATAKPITELPFDVRFLLTATVPAGTISVDYWWAPIGKLKKEQCDTLSALALTKLVGDAQHDRWTAVDGGTSAVLYGGPLQPNREYTFCLHTRRSLTQDELRAFRDRASAGLLAAYKIVAGSGGQFKDLEALRRYQTVLARAIPARPSWRAVYEKNADLFVDRSAGRESPQEQAKRDAAAMAFFPSRLDLLGWRSARIQSIEASANAFASDFDALAASPAFVALASSSPDLARHQEDRSRFADALATAAAVRVAVPGERQGEFELAGEGAGVLGKTDLAALHLSSLAPWSSADVAPYAQNLARTSAILEALTEFATDLFYRESADRPRGLNTRHLQDLIRSLAKVREDIDAQRSKYVLLATTLESLHSDLASIVSSISVVELSSLVFLGSAATTYVERSKWYIGMDLGVLGAFGDDFGGFHNRFDGGAFTPYLGANFYFRPVNKNAPLATCTEACFAKRFSVTIGITTSSIKEDKVRDDLFGGENLYTAVGLRITDYVRVGGGVIIFRSFRPLVGTNRISATPALSASIDWDIKGTVGAVGDALWPKK